MRKMKKKGNVTATEAAKNFGRLVTMVRDGRTEVVVERAGVAVARIAPVADVSFTGRDLVDLFARIGAPGDEFRREVEAGRARLNAPEVPRNPWAS
jgi:antitoxin (DNA-binding transcriptional repressor) of toxin-antitoxin stability system